MRPAQYYLRGQMAELLGKYQPELGKKAHCSMKRSIHVFMLMTKAASAPSPSRSSRMSKMLSSSSLRRPARAAWKLIAYGGISPIAVPMPQSTAVGITFQKTHCQHHQVAAVHVATLLTWHRNMLRNSEGSATEGPQNVFQTFYCIPCPQPKWVDEDVQISLLLPLFVGVFDFATRIGMAGMPCIDGC